MKMTNEFKQNLTGRMLVITCLALALGLAGCEQKDKVDKGSKKIDQGTERSEQRVDQPAGQAMEPATGTTGKAGEYVDDSVITMRVKTAISDDALLKGAKIEVTTVNGEVKLSGTVDSQQSINRAVEVANSQKNVKSVQSDLVVNPGAPSR
jgi:hyperosmotically inducible protein